jgi:hypothetical protein
LAVGLDLHIAWSAVLAPDIADARAETLRFVV